MDEDDKTVVIAIAMIFGTIAIIVVVFALLFNGLSFSTKCRHFCEDKSEHAVGYGVIDLAGQPKMCACYESASEWNNIKAQFEGLNED